jgi:hypothetical protein
MLTLNNHLKCNLLSIQNHSQSYNSEIFFTECQKILCKIHFKIHFIMCSLTCNKLRNPLKHIFYLLHSFAIKLLKRKIEIHRKIYESWSKSKAERNLLTKQYIWFLKVHESWRKSSNWPYVSVSYCLSFSLTSIGAGIICLKKSIWHPNLELQQT